MHIKYLPYMPISKMVELNLSPSQMLLCGIIVSFNKDNKSLRAGYSKIGKAINVSGKTVERDIKKLLDLKLITVKSGKKERNANEYKPTKLLLSLYGQKVSINIDKLSNHRSSKEDHNKPSYAASLAKQHNFVKEYQQDLKDFNEEYALQRLEYRINIKTKIN